MRIVFGWVVNGFIGRIGSVLYLVSFINVDV